MISIGLLLATGLTNMFLIPARNVIDEGANYGMLVGIKFLLAMPIFFIVSTLNGRSQNAARFREKSRLWLNIAVILCVLLVCLAGYIRFIDRQPKAENPVSLGRSVLLVRTPSIAGPPPEPLSGETLNADRITGYGEGVINGQEAPG